MYCSKCGNQLNDSDKFCSNCGNANIELQPNTQQNINNSNTSNSQSEYNNITNNYENTPSTTNTIALAAIICSIVGFFIYGILLGIIALILGIIAYQQPNISYKNKQTALGAIIFGIIDIVGALVFTNMLFW